MVLGQHLERDLVLEAFVLGAQHRGEATRADDAGDAVAADPVGGHRPSSRSSPSIDATSARPRSTRVRAVDSGQPRRVATSAYGSCSTSRNVTACR